MIVNSYTSVNGFCFSNGCPDDVESTFGIPVKIRKTRLDNIEYIYDEFIVRFDSSLSFMEITLLPFMEASIDGIPITWDPNFLKKLCLLDGNPKIVYGFIILEKFGIAVTGIHDNDTSQMAITFFKKEILNFYLSGSVEFDFRCLA